MQRRYFLLALAGSAPLSGCTDGVLGAELSSDSPESMAIETDLLDLGDRPKIASTVIADGRDEVELGDEVRVQIKVVLPVENGIYDARLVISLRNSDRDDIAQHSTEVESTEDNRSVTVEYGTPFSTNHIDPGTYHAHVRVEDNLTNTTAEAETIPVEIV